jgi:serine/threonine protein kinase/Flp pilus assembly protein TadD
VDDASLEVLNLTLAGSDETVAAGASRSPVELQRVAHYRILRQLGAGGMGTVYLAHDEKMDRQVALKVMSRHQGASEKAGQRFAQEAWIAGRLDHPNLVKVYERGTWQELSWFSMELVGGGSLAEVLDNLRLVGRDPRTGLQAGTSQYVHWALRRVIEAAHGLDYAHRHGVVHRDVKPMNLLLASEPAIVKIADFGLAIDAEATRMTTVGAVLGTIAFMAPEQIRGEQDAIDARTDVYALGVTLFELLTLELPFTGKTQQLYVSQVLTAEARRASKLNSQVSRDLEVVLRKAMEKERRDRYQTAAAFADDLENVLHLRPILATPTGRIKRVTKWVRRKPVHAALVATLLLSVPTLAAVAVDVVAERLAARRQRIESLLGEARWLEERLRHGEVVARASEVLSLDRGNLRALAHRALARGQLAASSSTAAEGERERLRSQALADIDRVVAALPDRSWPHGLKTFLLHLGGDEEGAAAERALAARHRSDPLTDEDLTEEARLAFVMKDYPRSAELFSELVRRDPGRVRAISSRALAWEHLKRPEEAYVDYRVVVGLAPEEYLALTDLARLSVDRKQLADARAYIEQAAALAPESGNVHEIMSFVFNELGIAAGLAGDRAEAERLFLRAAESAEKAIALEPEWSWSRLNLGTSLMERNRLLPEPDPELLRQALDAYSRYLAGVPALPDDEAGRATYFAALSNSCDVLIQLGRLEEALATCARVTAAFPTNPVGFYNLAGVHALLGRSDEALAALERDVQLGDTEWEYLERDRWFAGLNDDPRFRALVERMKHRAQPGT